MKTLGTQIMGVLLTLVLLFTFLYNPYPDGGSLGMSIYALPPLAVSIAGLLANLTWILGVLLVLGFAMYVAAMIGVDTLANHDKIHKSITREMDSRPEQHHVLITPNDLRNDDGGKLIARGNVFARWVMFPSNIATALLGVATGFWFTGSSWLLVMLAHRVFVKVLHKECAELIMKRVTETAPQRAVRVAKAQMAEAVNGTVQRMRDDDGFRQKVEDEVLGEK